MGIFDAKWAHFIFAFVWILAQWWLLALWVCVVCMCGWYDNGLRICLLAGWLCAEWYDANDWENCQWVGAWMLFDYCGWVRHELYPWMTPERIKPVEIKFNFFPQSSNSTLLLSRWKGDTSLNELIVPLRPRISQTSAIERFHSRMNLPQKEPIDTCCHLVVD